MLYCLFPVDFSQLRKSRPRECNSKAHYACNFHWSINIGDIPGTAIIVHFTNRLISRAHLAETHRLSFYRALQKACAKTYCVNTTRLREREGNTRSRILLKKIDIPIRRENPAINDVCPRAARVYASGS